MVMIPIDRSLARADVMDKYCRTDYEYENKNRHQILYQKNANQAN